MLMFVFIVLLALYTLNPSGRRQWTPPVRM